MITPSSHAFDGREPFHHHAFFERLLQLEIVGRHAVAGAAVDDDGLGCAEPLGSTRDIERGVAAAIDNDAPAEQRLCLAFHGAQDGNSVEDFACFPRRDVCALGDVRADREKSRVEAVHRHRFEDVYDLDVEMDAHPELDNARDLGIEHVAR